MVKIDEHIEIELVWLDAGETRHRTLVLPAGARVADALAQGRELGAVAGRTVGVWGQPVSGAHPLRAGDRVEIYGERLDAPKLRRRER